MEQKAGEVTTKSLPTQYYARFQLGQDEPLLCETFQRAGNRQTRGFGLKDEQNKNL